jgi:hypothetical protein
MEQSPFTEANQFAASQETSHILRNLKVHYHIHKCLPPVPILSQHNPVYTPTSHFLKIHLNIILLSMPGSPKHSLSLWFPHQNPVHTSPLPHTSYMPCPSHSYWLYTTSYQSNFLHLNFKMFSTEVFQPKYFVTVCPRFAWCLLIGT